MWAGCSGTAMFNAPPGGRPKGAMEPIVNDMPAFLPLGVELRPMGLTSDAAEAFARGEITKLAEALGRLAQPPYPELLRDIAAKISGSLRAGGRVLFCGNGGSAADAQHLAAELVGRQNYDRPPAAGIALTADTSALTAIGNDYGFDQVFSRQVEAISRPGDVLVGISTSGCSANVVEAIAAAKRLGLTTVALTGADPASMGSADFVVAVPATETAKIQELQITCGHIMLALVELQLHAPQGLAGAGTGEGAGAGGRPGDTRR